MQGKANRVRPLHMVEKCIGGPEIGTSGLAQAWLLLRERVSLKGALGEMSLYISGLPYITKD